ncbi:cytochrome b/b6 domain-containing protein [Variovorax sp. J2P1-59]|uniref:cytochrome b/b6 domain-containing protein n=1 Tax=Variovorax flavidus TaxID=3053501 RepID=UPI00257866F0|nr:cytochrome b/b6 domain-containing protein [Variovorax sp. J2P1-59]MDM0074807.1 cytochrome b/b6 domain-containing protein [Variovorax sp. J2P1-59]
MTISSPSPVTTPPAARRQLIRRHSATVRITHWLNVACLSFLLMSGLQIFNAHPRLYWGQYGADADPAFIAIGATPSGDTLQGFLQIGPVSVRTTGFLGVSEEGDGATSRAFPAWMTIPSYHDLGAGRHWHLFFAWLLVFNGLIYLTHGLWSGHFRRDFLPSVGQLTARHLWHEVLDHARLRFARGEAARRYNVLQKLSYLVVVFGLLPLMVLTGLTMSPGLDATFHFLPDLFGGRPSARTLHFISAFLLVLFVVVHVVMVIVSGLWNNLRSMLSGRYVINDEGVSP